MPEAFAGLVQGFVGECWPDSPVCFGRAHLRAGRGPEVDDRRHDLRPSLATLNSDAGLVSQGAGSIRQLLKA
jgi:hypothetical protein